MATSTSLRIALAQTCPLSAQAGEKPRSGEIFRVLEHNLSDARVQVERAANEGADVVVFPEYFLQGLLDEGRQVWLHLVVSLTAVPRVSGSTSRRQPFQPSGPAQNLYRRHDRLPRLPGRAQLAKWLTI